MTWDGAKSTQPNYLKWKTSIQGLPSFMKDKILVVWNTKSTVLWFKGYFSVKFNECEGVWYPHSNLSNWRSLSERAATLSTLLSLIASIRFKGLQRSSDTLAQRLAGQHLTSWCQPLKLKAWICCYCQCFKSRVITQLNSDSPLRTERKSVEPCQRTRVQLCIKRRSS